MNFLKLIPDTLNVADISDLVKHTECNAISIFVETYKSRSRRLYISESENTTIKLEKIASEIRKKWSNVMHLAIYLKLGSISLNEINIVVAISSPYLSDSMEAVQFAVNKIRSLKPSETETNFISNIRPISETDLSSDVCVADDVPSDLIQIKADNCQINKRIENFILMKRTALDDRNIKEFLQVESGTHIDDKPRDPQCARVDAVLWKRTDSKSHLKVHKVVNEWGPQAPKIQHDKTNPSDKLVETGVPKSINERLSNCEKHVGVEAPVPVDIYARLKQIEDRILELDSISPEYSNFWLKKTGGETYLPSDVNKSSARTIFVNSHPKVLKRKYTLEDLGNKIAKMKHNIDRK